MTFPTDRISRDMLDDKLRSFERSLRLPPHTYYIYGLNPGDGWRGRIEDGEGCTPLGARMHTRRELYWLIDFAQQAVWILQHNKSAQEVACATCDGGGVTDRQGTRCPRCEGTGLVTSQAQIY